MAEKSVRVQRELDDSQANLRLIKSFLDLRCNLHADSLCEYDTYPQVSLIQLIDISKKYRSLRYTYRGVVVRRYCGIEGVRGARGGFSFSCRVYCVALT